MPAAPVRSEHVARAARCLEHAAVCRCPRDASVACADHFSRERFIEAFAAVLGAALYLPSAGCFALVPLLSSLPRTGQPSGAVLDYHAPPPVASQLTAQRRLSCGPLLQLWHAAFGRLHQTPASAVRTPLWLWHHSWGHCRTHCDLGELHWSARQLLGECS